MNATRTHRRLVTAALATALATALALLAPTTTQAASVDATPQATLHLAQAKTSENPREFHRWKRRWNSRIRELRKIRPERDFAYSQQRNGGRRFAIALQTPLPTHQPHGIEVEWFFVYLGDSGLGAGMTARIESWNRGWLGNLRRHGVENVRIVRTPVSDIEGLQGGSTNHRRRHQELVLAHGTDLSRPPARQVHEKLISYLAAGHNALSISSKADAMRFLKNHRLPKERYLAAAGTAELAARMRANDERLAHVIAEARRVNPKSALSPHDPIFLINGRYVVLGSTTRSVIRAYQVANWVIARELGDTWPLTAALQTFPKASELPSLRFDSIAYGNTDKARTRRAIKLHDPVPTKPGKVTVERFFSYETYLGRTFGTHFRAWTRTLPETIGIVTSPIGLAWRSGDAAAKRHQEIMMAGRPLGQDHTLHNEVWNRFDHLGTEGNIETDDDLTAVLTAAKIPRDAYEQALSDPAVQKRLHEVNARYSLLTNEARETILIEPILLINGKYALLGLRFKTLKALFHTANALIAAELERAD